MTKKLEQSAREVIRQHSMECLSDKTVDALREALAEQVHTPYCKQAPMCKTPCGNSDCVEQAEQEPVVCKSVPVEPTEDMLLAAELSKPRGYRELYSAMINAAPQPVKQEPVAEAIAAEARLHRAVRAVASQAGESAEDTIEWLCNGGMAQLFECHFSGKNRESLCEDEGCPHRGVPHICIEKQAEQEPVADVYFDCRGGCRVNFLVNLREAFPAGAKLYAAPVRTKDLTDDEIYEAVIKAIESGASGRYSTVRAVIAAYKEKNK